MGTARWASAAAFTASAAPFTEGAAFVAGGYGRGEKFGEKALYSVLVRCFQALFLEVLSSVECLALGSKGSQTQISICASDIVLCMDCE